MTSNGIGRWVMTRPDKMKVQDVSKGDFCADGKLSIRSPLSTKPSLVMKTPGFLWFPAQYSVLAAMWCSTLNY